MDDVTRAMSKGGDACGYLCKISGKSTALPPLTKAFPYAYDYDPFDNLKLNLIHLYPQPTKVHTDNIQNLQIITNTNNAMEGTFTSYLEGLLEVKDLFDHLQADLGMVSGTNSVEGMYRCRPTRLHVSWRIMSEVTSQTILTAVMIK